MKCELNRNNIITCIANIHNNGLVWLFQAFDDISHVIISKIQFSSNIFWSFVDLVLSDFRQFLVHVCFWLPFFYFFFFFISRQIFDVWLKLIGGVLIKVLYWNYFLNNKQQYLFCISKWNLTALKWNCLLDVHLEILILREKKKHRKK